MISITCKKRPSASKKQQKQKNNNVESNKSKKCDVKDGQNGGEKDLTIKEIAAAPSNAIIPPQDEKQNVKDESRKEKVNEDLEGPSKKELYATPGPSNILPKLDPAEIKEASEVFPVASLKVNFYLTLIFIQNTTGLLFNL
uniref:Uncharacterized protein n=1 Tax=Panagrolaimus davidi TaxID=227884 RepID=A0A914PHX2_9BILA